MNSGGERYPRASGRVNLIVVGDPRKQLAHDRLCIGTRTDADVVAFDSADEGFGHSVALHRVEVR